MELDPKFGLGYQGLAAMSMNLGQTEEANKYIQEALRYLDGMTERERFSTRGLYYRMIGDYQQCVKEYGELIAQFPADTLGHAQRAACLAKLRDMRGRHRRDAAGGEGAAQSRRLPDEPRALRRPCR